MAKFHMHEVFGAVTMGERGQIVIPAHIRKVFSIKPGDRLIVFAKENDGPIGLIPAEQFSQFLEHATQMLAKIKKINNA